MDIRLLALPLCSLLFLSGCNSSSSNQEPSPNANLAGELVKESSKTVIDPSALTKANNLLNRDLYYGLKKDNENLFYSSYSIFSALSMTYAGAQNQTKAEFESVLHYDENLSVHESFAALLSQSSYDYNTFDVANSIWPQENYPFKENFIYTVYNGYNSLISYQDYMNDFESARLNINNWVEDNTHDKIIDLLPPQSLDASTRMVLVNALYFKGTWEVEFDKNDTNSKSFHLADGSQKEVDMMHMNSDDLSYYEEAYFSMLELPYKENEFSMLLFLPTSSEDMTALETTLFETSSPLQIRSAAHKKEVTLSLPKFTIKWGTKSIKDFLMAQGMIEAFDGGLADFTGMWQRQEDENLYISDVLHQTFIEVNEEGAEAAAATAVIIAEPTAMPSAPKVFNADHPFIFFIVDNTNNTIVFSGRLENP